MVAFPPGGPTDFVGRLVAEKMTALLGQRVYIDNKPGANGTLGGGDVAKSDPDGYSLFLTTAGAVTVSPHIMPSMPYDTLRDFAPVALVTKVTEVLVVTPKLGIKPSRILSRSPRQKPGTITFASTGIGSPPHLAQVLLAASAGVEFLHVPYRGAAPALTDLLGGQVQVVALDVPVVIAQIQAGMLLPIGAAADKRDAILPDVPTLAEQGYPNTDASNWYGCWRRPRRRRRRSPSSTKPSTTHSTIRRCTTSSSKPARRRSAARRIARHLHEGRIREMGTRGPRARHQGDDVVGSIATYPGRYSPVAGSRFSFGSASRSTGSTGALSRARRRARRSRGCTSLYAPAHQRRRLPISPSAKTNTGGIIVHSPSR